jgi:hypothetical protein
MARSSRARAAVAIVPALAASLAACNALVGLDQFEKVACSRSCDAGSIDAEGLDASDASDAADVEADAPFVIPLPDGASPTSWARWPMPNPDGGGGKGIATHSYSATDAAVVDGVTNLVWGLRLGSKQAGDFDGALTHCREYDDAGTSWRLPTRIELVTLIDYMRTGGAAIDPVFTGVGGWVWTSSVVRPPTDPYKFWSVNFTTGEVGPAPAGAVTVLCVRGP